MSPSRRARRRCAGRSRSTVSPRGSFHGRDQHATALHTMITTGIWKVPFTAANFANEMRSASRADTYQNGMPVFQEPEAAGQAHPSFVFPSRTLEPAQCRVTSFSRNLASKPLK